MTKRILLALFLMLPIAAHSQTDSADLTFTSVMDALASGRTENIPAGNLRDAIDSVASTGWGQWADTANTCDGTPLSFSGNVDNVLPNNGAAAITGFLPSDVDTFYDGSVITGRAGDGIMITVDMVSTPTSASTTYIEVWMDIGGAVGELYRRIISFPKGNGVTRPINFTVSGYTLGTWEENGATVYVRGNGTFDVCDVRYIITRTHAGYLSQ